MIKAAIIGCGKIADKHAGSIERIAGSKIVGVCDREELMAKQIYERFNVKRYFSDVNELLEVERPDVVHVTTPPQSHFHLGRLCLEAGCHVFIEKPFTLNTAEASELIQLATAKNLKMTAGHTVQYSDVAIRMRRLIKSGYLGGPPVHMESIYCYDFGDQRFAKALLGDKEHWVKALPGKLLQNIISHGISKIAEFLTDDSPQVIAHGFTSSFLESIGETEIIDELRVIIRDGQTTAYFTFSSQMSPTLHQFRIYGPKNALIADDDHQTLIKLCATNYKSYLNFFIPPAIYSKQFLANSGSNISRFIRGDLHNDAGMKALIESFYRSISDGSPLPISYREILVTSKIMDDIFSQVNPQ